MCSFCLLFFSLDKTANSVSWFETFCSISKKHDLVELSKKKNKNRFKFNMKLRVQTENSLAYHKS